jgi:hypothetical protein
LIKTSSDACLAIRFIKERQQKDQIEVSVATKFAALPWRFGRGSVLSALKKSLDRLGLASVELYQLHWLVLPLSMQVHVLVRKNVSFYLRFHYLLPGQGFGGTKVPDAAYVPFAKAKI